MAIHIIFLSEEFNKRIASFVPITTIFIKDSCPGPRMILIITRGAFFVILLSGWVLYPIPIPLVLDAPVLTTLRIV